MTSVNSGDSSPLTHVRSDGSSHMVDVSGKAVTTREAVASATLTSRADVIDRVLAGELPKGRRSASPELRASWPPNAHTS